MSKKAKLRIDKLAKTDMILPMESKEIRRSVSLKWLLGILIASNFALFGFLLERMAEVHKLRAENIELHSEISDLKEKNRILIKKLELVENIVKALKKPYPAEVLPDLKEWRKYVKEYPIQFYIFDDLGDSVDGASVSVVASGQTVLSEIGGLTPEFWVKIGKKISIQKDGFESEREVIGQKDAQNGLVRVMLRRKSHAEQEQK